jgi:hypothetical protein
LRVFKFHTVGDSNPRSSFANAPRQGM